MRLTAKGRSLLAKALPIWKAHHAALDEQIRPADRLRRDLIRLVRPDAEIEPRAARSRVPACAD